MALEVLRKLGVTAEQVRRQTRRVMEDSASGPAAAGHAPLARREEKKEAKTPLVDQLAVDLTVLAEEGKLDPVIGRQQEIERVIQILARRNKNNPALIGEPGVGKTASWRVWRNVSLKATCPLRSSARRCSNLMWVHWSQVRCTAVSSRNASSG